MGFGFCCPGEPCSKPDRCLRNQDAFGHQHLEKSRSISWEGGVSTLTDVSQREPHPVEQRARARAGGAPPASVAEQVLGMRALAHRPPLPGRSERRGTCRCHRSVPRQQRDARAICLVAVPFGVVDILRRVGLLASVELSQSMQTRRRLVWGRRSCCSLPPNTGSSSSSL